MDDNGFVDNGSSLRVVVFPFPHEFNEFDDIAGNPHKMKSFGKIVHTGTRDTVTLDSLKREIMGENVDKWMRQTQYHMYMRGRNRRFVERLVPVYDKMAHREKYNTEELDIAIYNKYCTELNESNIDEAVTDTLFCVIRSPELEKHLPIFILKDRKEEMYECMLLPEEVVKGKERLCNILRGPQNLNAKEFRYKLSGTDNFIDDSKTFSEENIQLPCFIETFHFYPITFKLIGNRKGSPVCHCKKVLGKLNVEKHKKIGDLRQLLHQQFPDITELPFLYCGNQKLSDAHTIEKGLFSVNAITEMERASHMQYETWRHDEYDIDPELMTYTDSVFVTIPSEGYVPITLTESPSRSCRTVFVNSMNCKVDDIMRLVEEEMGIAKHVQKLSINSVVLTEGKFLHECEGFPKKRDIWVTKEPLLRVEISTGKTEAIELEMLKTTEVKQLKEKIHSMTGVKTSKQSLILLQDSNEIDLKDESKLSSYVFRKRMTQNLKLKLIVYENKNVFRIKSSKSNAFSVPVNDTTRATASILRELMAQELKVNTAKITLVSPITGDVLDDVKLLSEYRFPDNVMLYAKVTDTSPMRTDNIITVYMATQDGQIFCKDGIRADGRLFYAVDGSQTPVASKVCKEQTEQDVQGTNGNGIAKFAEEIKSLDTEETENNKTEAPKCQTGTNVDSSRHASKMQKSKGYKVRHIVRRLHAGVTSDESDYCSEHFSSVDDEDSYSDMEFTISGSINVHVADYGDSVPNFPWPHVLNSSTEILTETNLPSAKINSAIVPDDSGFSSENGLSSDTNSDSCSDIDDTETSKHQVKSKQMRDSKKNRGEVDESDTPGYTFFQTIHVSSSPIFVSPDKHQKDYPNPHSDEESPDKMSYDKLTRQDILMASEHLPLQSDVVEDMSETENFSHNDTYNSGIEQCAKSTIESHQMKSNVMGKIGVMEHSQQMPSELPHEFDGHSHSHSDEMLEHLSQICAKGLSQWEKPKEKMADGEMIHGSLGGDRGTCRSLVTQSVAHCGRITDSEASGNGNTSPLINQSVQFESSNVKSVNESTHKPASAVMDKGIRPEKEHNGTSTELDDSNQPIDGKIESNHICNKEDYINSEENCKSHVVQVIQRAQSNHSNLSSAAQPKIVKTMQCIHDALEDEKQEVITSHDVQNPNDSKTTLETRLAHRESNTNCEGTRKSQVVQLHSNQITSPSSTLTKTHEKKRDDRSTRSTDCHGTSTSPFIQKSTGEEKWKAGFSIHAETGNDCQTRENPMKSQATADNSETTVTLLSVSDKTDKYNNVGSEKEITTPKQMQVDLPEQRIAPACDNDVPLNGNCLHSCNDSMACLPSQKAENFQGKGKGTNTNCQSCSLIEKPSNQNGTRLNHHSDNVDKRGSNKVSSKKSKHTGQCTGHTNPASQSNISNAAALSQRIENHYVQERKTTKENARVDDTGTHNTKKLCTIKSAFHEQNISTGDKVNKSQNTSQIIDDSSPAKSTVYCTQNYKQSGISCVTSQQSFPGETTYSNSSFKEPKRKRLKKLWYKMSRRRKKKLKNNPRDGTPSTSSVCDESVGVSKSRLESPYFWDDTSYENGKNKPHCGAAKQEMFAEGTDMQPPYQVETKSLGCESIPDFTDKPWDNHQSETDIAIQKTLIGVKDARIPVIKTRKFTEENNRPISVDMKLSNVDAPRHKSPTWLKSNMISDEGTVTSLPPFQSPERKGLQRQAGCVNKFEEMKSDTQLVPVEDDTLHNLARAIGCNWKMIARCLHVKEAEVERITADNPYDCYEQAFQMLRYWKRSNEASICTEAVLRSALVEADRRDLADKFLPKPPDSEAKLQHCMSHKSNNVVKGGDKGKMKQKSSLKKIKKIFKIP